MYVCQRMACKGFFMNPVHLSHWDNSNYSSYEVLSSDFDCPGEKGSLLLANVNVNFVFPVNSCTTFLLTEF